MTMPPIAQSTGRSIWLIAYRGLTDALAKSVMFLITIAATRTLPRAEVGTLALAMTVGWLASVLADSGIQMHLAREAAQHPERIGRTVDRWLPVRLWSGLVCVAGAVALLAATSPRDVLLAGALLAVAYGINGVTECLFHIFRGLRRTDIESTLTLVQRGSLACTALAVFVWRPTLTFLALAFLLSASGTFVIALGLTRRVVRMATPASASPHEGVQREFLASVLPIGAGIVLSALYFRIDVFLLELWRGAADVGAYNAVFRLVEAMRLVPAAVLAVMLPSLFQARTRQLLAKVSLMLTLGAAASVAALWPFATPLVSLVYGPDYADAAGTFRILLLSFPLMSLNYALTSQLIGWHGHRTYAGICAGALVVNVLLNARFITTLGMEGAAWATLCTEVVLTAGCTLALARVQLEPGYLPAAAMEVR